MDNCKCKATQNCQAIIKKYKNICEKAWYAKCNANSLPEYNNSIQRLANQCATYRIEYQNKCCPCRDPGHSGAITKMMNIVQDCENTLRRAIPTPPTSPTLRKPPGF